MTGKQRAKLRAEANTLEPVLWLGKGGISDAFIEQADGVLNTQELIKVKILLDTTPIEPKEAARETAAKTGAEIIQVIGGTFILYRYNPELHKKKKPVSAKVLQKNSENYYASIKSPKEHKDALRRKKAAARKSGK